MKLLVTMLFKKRFNEITLPAGNDDEIRIQNIEHHDIY